MYGVERHKLRWTVFETNLEAGVMCHASLACVSYPLIRLEVMRTSVLTVPLQLGGERILNLVR